ncbi:MBL fold metallo-hydrolase [Nocardioides sp.]|uniref:MBL fold metallo-hydrolase n=1 Tax=Nocardioides sp. TaxID=35761 RepID=UPI002ED1C524
MLGDRGQAVAGPAYATWVGHATMLVELAGVRVLTDPVLTQRVGHLRRRSAPPDARVRQTDIVVISHAHGDHLHRRSLRLVLEASPDTLVVVPRGAAVHLPATRSARVEEVVVGDVVEHGGLRIEVVPAVHSGRRGKFGAEEASAVGYVLGGDDRRLWFAGDTDLFPEMDAIGPVDLAAVPISGWWRRLGPGHLDEERAVEAAVLVKAQRVLPIHWGTFSPEDMLGGLPRWLPETARRFERALDERGLLDLLVRLEPGQTVRW